MLLLWKARKLSEGKGITQEWGGALCRFRGMRLPEGCKGPEYEADGISFLLERFQWPASFRDQKEKFAR